MIPAAVSSRTHPKSDCAPYDLVDRLPVGVPLQDGVHVLGVLVAVDHPHYTGMVHAAEQLNLPSDVIAPRHAGFVDGLDSVLPAARPAEALAHGFVVPGAEDGCTHEIVVEDVVAAFFVRRDAAGCREGIGGRITRFDGYSTQTVLR